jgi:hypothetical protein
MACEKLYAWQVTIILILEAGFNSGIANDLINALRHRP